MAIDIAKHLHDLILSGVLKPGDSLPGQRELAAYFGASMTSVREAISALAGAGLVSAHPGRGTIVLGLANAEPAFDGWLGPASDKEELKQLFEARRLLETFLVKKVTHTASPEQKASLRHPLKKMEKAISDPEAFVDADMAFHQRIADIAGNRVLARMMRAIRAPMKRQLYEGTIRRIERYGDMSNSVQTHLQLVEAIERGDSEEAVALLNTMIDRTEKLLTE